VAGAFEQVDEPSGSGATELITGSPVLVVLTKAFRIAYVKL
jgi:hypothetical protein